MMKRITIILASILFLSSCNQNETRAPWRACFDGLTNTEEQLDKPYVTSGHKAQIIGIQNGSFPDLGGHVPGEMGGIWTGAFKIADGFAMSIADTKTDNDLILKAESMTVFPHKTQFDYGDVLDGVKVQSTQFASDQNAGVVVEYTVTNTSEILRNLKLGFILNVDIFPVWFSRENGILDGKDEILWDKSHEIFKARDLSNEWYVAWGSDTKIESYDQTEELIIPNQGNVTSASMYSTISLKSGQSVTVRYAMASSKEGYSHAIDTYSILLSNYEQQLEQKSRDYKDLLSRSVIDIPDQQLQNAYYWTLINNRWLETNPDDLGYFLCAGAIEYPWLFGCDNSYSLQGLLRTGNFELVKSTLRMLNKVSMEANGNGRIIHEMSSNGFVGNRGNTQETAHFIMALWRTFEWTGDMELLKEIYPTAKLGLHWLTHEQDTNNNMYPEGYGIMEVKGLNAELIDVAVYTQQAMEAVSKMAEIFGEKEYAADLASKAQIMKDKINTEFWDEQQSSYCDFYGSSAQAIQTSKGAIEQLMLSQGHSDYAGNLEKIEFYENLIKEISAKYPEDYHRGWFTNKNWVINTPMECSIAPKERAVVALQKIHDNNCGAYGPYLSAVEKKHMMTISTGVQAVAEARNGRIDYAIEYLDKIAETLGLNMPGAINEMMPDYGCPYQAWTIYGMPVVLVSECFGIQPNAYNKTITLAPQMPSSWDSMQIKDVRVGDNEISVSIRRVEGRLEIDYELKKTGWSVDLVLPEDIEGTVVCNGIECIR